MSDLVERLEDEARDLNWVGIERGSQRASLSASLAQEAADRIEALEAECAQLRDKTIDLLNTGTEAMIALVKRAEVAEAACERLREAITEAVKLLGMDRPINPSDILRAALRAEAERMERGG